MTIVYSKPSILKFQADAKAAGFDLAVDGIWGRRTEQAFITYMAGKLYEGATFPYDDYKPVSVNLNQTMRAEYLPALNRALQGQADGMKLLCTVMAHIEGFYPKSRSYKTRNPGNVGNTDSGANQTFATLEEGIKAQADYITRVATGKHKAYPFSEKVLKPFYSDEVQRNREKYGIPPQSPGYRFTFTGQLDQFTKVYAVGARNSNRYVNQITSYFAQHGLAVTPQSKLQDIIELC